jgi:mRNA interferase RelE/StbE
MYQVQFTRTALKHLGRIDQKQKRRIVVLIEERLTLDPTLGMPLKGRLKGLWKLRVGRCRVIYQFSRGRLVVIVVEVQHRKDVYRG